MSRRELLAQRINAGLIALTLRDGGIEDIAVDRDGSLRIGSIHLGRIGRLTPNMRAAFVELGGGGSGLLRASDVRPRPPPDVEIGSVLRSGEPVLVQVKAAHGGDKAPAVSMEISLPGRLLVYLPLGRGINLSRRIADADQRARLSETPCLNGNGWIVRARAATADPRDIETEAAVLSARWDQISARLPKLSPPALVEDGPSAPIRLLIEAAALPTRAEVSDLVSRREIERWAADHGHALGAAAVTGEEQDIFTFRDLHGRITELLSPEVPLPSGGTITIEPTKALTAIDVDSGAGCTPLQANLEAAEAIARHLRLRHVGGIVVIDFITMRREQDRKKLLSRLSQALSEDPVPSQLYGMSTLGLVQLVRERRGLPLSQLLSTET